MTARLKVNPPVGSLPVLQYCAPDQLSIDDTYQRTLETSSSQRLIRKIAIHWDWGLCQPLFVARRADGGLYVVDGQHRLAAAKLRADIWQLPCVVTSFDTASAEAASFVSLNQQRRPLTALDLFRAAVASGDVEAMAITVALEKAGLRIAKGTNNQGMRPGSVANIGGLQNCYRSKGQRILELSLLVLAGAYPREILRYSGTIFPGIVALVHDQVQLGRESEAELVQDIATFVGRRPQAKWYSALLAAVAAEPQLTRKLTAEKLYRREWQVRGDAPVTTPIAPASKLKPAEVAWCEQCDQRVSGARVTVCKDRFCKFKEPA